MVLTDYKIAKKDCDKEEAKRQVKTLQSQSPAVKIISVSIGPVAEPQEMKNIGVNKDDIIKSSGLEIHNKVGKKIAASKLYAIHNINFLLTDRGFGSRTAETEV